MSNPPRRQTAAADEQPGLVARAAIRLTAWTEKWIPDAFIFALARHRHRLRRRAASGRRRPFTQVVDAWGNGFWDLIPFTLQMSLIIITGHVLATSAPMGAAIRAIAGVAAHAARRGGAGHVLRAGELVVQLGLQPDLQRGARAEVARRVQGVDYRALAAASLLGLGSIWAQGLSGSAALQMATPGALQPQIRDIVANGGIVPGGIIPFRDTIFLWQSFVSVARRDRGRDAGDVAGDAAGQQGARPRATSASISAKRNSRRAPSRSAIAPGAWLEHSPILNVIVVAIGGDVSRPLLRPRRRSRSTRSPSTSSTSRFLLVGVLLHRTPARLMHAVQAATPAVWGVILQFPFYAGIAAIITATHLNEQLANAFVSVSTPASFPGGGGDLLGGARRVRAVGRIEVGDRSAVRDGRGARAQGAPRLGGRRRTISARRWRTWCSRSGCCRSWACSGCARAT